MGIGDYPESCGISPEIWQARHDRAVDLKEKMRRSLRGIDTAVAWGSEGSNMELTLYRYALLADIVDEYFPILDFDEVKLLDVGCDAGILALDWIAREEREGLVAFGMDTNQQLSTLPVEEARFVGGSASDFDFLKEQFGDTKFHCITLMKPRFDRGAEESVQVIQNLSEFLVEGGIIVTGIEGSCHRVDEVLLESGFQGEKWFEDYEPVLTK